MTHAEPVVPLRAAAPLSICVLGGSGFVGSELVAGLAAARHRVRVLTRHAASAQHLLVLPTVEVVVTDIHNPPALARQFAGIDVVVNLVGILNERGRNGSGFRRAHTELAGKIVAAARAARVGRILQMSALGADARHGPSHYLQTKGAAEEAIRAGALGLDFVIFRPSVIFGPGDGFTNRFAQLLRLAGGALPLPGARTRFAPVYVGDVAAAFCRALAGAATSGETYELCGPDSMTLEELVRLIAATLGIRAKILPVPAPVARLQALVMDFVPGKPFSTDNWKSLQRDSVCRENGCARLGITPVALRAVLPGYLARGSGREARFETYRSRRSPAR